MLSALRLAAGPASAARNVRCLATAAGSSYPGALLNVPKTQVTKLPSGLLVATESNPALATATVGVWIDSGSRAETKATNGVAHFLEHISFKGTQQRTQHGLELEIENMGGHLNAYTSREQTVYYAKLFAKDLPKGVGILGDILQHSTLDAKAIERERSVILREAEEVDKQVDEVVFDHLHAAAFPDNPLGFTILGPLKNIQSLQQADLKEYINANYTADRMVVVGAGNVDHAELCKLAEQHFAKLPTGTGKAKFVKPAFTGSDVRIRKDDMPTAHIAFAVEGAGWTSPDHWPLLVASAMIGSYDRGSGNAHPSSKLAQIVQQHHLANSFSSFNTTYSDTGLWGIYMQSNNRDNLDDLAHFTIREWLRLALAPSEGEVATAKQQLKTSLLLSLDGTTPVAEEIGRQMLAYGRRLSPYEIDRLVDAVTVEDVKRVAHEYIYDRDLVIVGVGPVEALPDYNRIRAAMNLLRY
ncbi:mitochondrial processing peptidase beta subunit 1 [Catenaria anguillulae PL171]|uniref:mitochondrial processing peptidase n=1 Tax=Catenaria anguillulae PL171 TaxID=765915 RepID=A0A1Y2HJD8_9FUNG|nr:mitochondrial processing peptidase beta subunit 1 [Catenaria anguillulae PL171]